MTVPQSQKSQPCTQPQSLSLKLSRNGCVNVYSQHFAKHNL